MVAIRSGTIEAGHWLDQPWAQPKHAMLTFLPMPIMRGSASHILNLPRHVGLGMEWIGASQGR